MAGWSESSCHSAKPTRVVSRDSASLSLRCACNTSKSTATRVPPVFKAIVLEHNAFQFKPALCCRSGRIGTATTHCVACCCVKRSLFHVWDFRVHLFVSAAWSRMEAEEEAAKAVAAL